MMRAELILLCFVYKVIATNITHIAQTFVVEKDVQVIASIQPFEIYKFSSLQLCAAQCSKSMNCCSASYASDFVCKLYNCCFPETVLSTEVKHIRKRPKTDLNAYPTDCSELPFGSDSGVYTIYPSDAFEVDVYCDMRFECGAGWTVIQRRFDGSVNFNVPWSDYKTGFGDITTEFWIGNDILHMMTTSKRYKLRLDMEDFNGTTAYALYDLFHVASETFKYSLSIGGYGGTAGDSMVACNNLDGKKFSTADNDNDDLNDNCAATIKMGGFWFTNCACVNPNGLYKPIGSFGHDTIHWRGFRDLTALRKISMKIKQF